MSLCCLYCFQVDSSHVLTFMFVDSLTQVQVYSCWQVPVEVQCRVW